MLPWRFRLYVSKHVEWKITELDRKWQNVPLNVSICDIQNIWKCNVNIECLCFVCILQLYIYLHCLQLNKVVKLHSLILTASCIYAVKVKKVQNQTYINCEEEESKKKTWNCSYKSWQIQKHLTFFTRWRKRSGVILLDFQEDYIKVHVWPIHLTGAAHQHTHNRIDFIQSNEAHDTHRMKGHQKDRIMS